MLVALNRLQLPICDLIKLKLKVISAQEISWIMLRMKQKVDAWWYFFLKYDNEMCITITKPRSKNSLIIVDTIDFLLGKFSVVI